MIKERDHGTIMRNVANEDDPTTQAMLEFLARRAAGPPPDGQSGGRSEG
jgi:hypothetical protein